MTKQKSNLIDLTLEVDQTLLQKALGNEKMLNFGHQGTHIDAMDKVFPTNYFVRDAVVFDVRKVKNGKIEIVDIDVSQIKKGDFVAFCSEFVESEGYGSKRYFKEHPYLSWALIDFLLEKEVAIIGVDFAGIRRGSEHTPTDQKCANEGIFIVENLCNLSDILQGKTWQRFLAYTFPVKFSGISGLPCRVAGRLLD